LGAHFSNSYFSPPKINSRGGELGDLHPPLLQFLTLHFPILGVSKQQAYSCPLVFLPSSAE
jgi:hypothetical protein